MRSGIDGATLALYTSGAFDSHIKITVENGSDTPIAIQSRVQSFTLQLPNPTEPIGSLDINFIRENTKEKETTSLSPLIVASTYNKLDNGITYSPLLQLGRTVVLSVALTAINGARPADGSGLWYEIFTGYIVDVDWPSYDGGRATVRCNGLAGIFQLAKSETAFTYPAGTSLEDVARDILDNNGFPWVSIDFPVATGKVIPVDYTPGLQKTVWEQLWALAQSMGWLVFYRYTGVNTLDLTFFEPARGKVTSDMTISFWRDFTQLSVDESEVRNAGYVQFFDENGEQVLIGPEEDLASLAKYGGSLGIRRPFWIAFDEESPIRSEADAQALLVAALSDVADPDAIATVTTPPLWFAEIGVDRYTFPTKDRLFDSDQLFAPFQVTIGIGPGFDDNSSQVAVRGVPTAGAVSWRNMTTDGGDVESFSFERDLRDWDLIDNEDGTKTFRATAGSAVGRVYVFDVLFDLTTVPLYPWPTQLTQYGTTLPIPPDRRIEYTFGDPPEGYVRKLEFLPVSTVNGTVGRKVRLIIEPDIVGDISDIPAGSIVAAKMVKSAQLYSFPDDAWAKTGWASIAWSAESLKFSDSEVYLIAAGSLNLTNANPYYIYWMKSSPNVFQWTQDFAMVIGDNVVLMATARRANHSDTLAFLGTALGMIGISDVEINARAIQAGNIRTNTITGVEIFGTSVSGIFADFGIMTAGTLQSGNGRFTLNLDATGTQVLLQMTDGSNPTIRILADGSATFYGTVASALFTAPAAVFNGTLQVDDDALFYGVFEHQGASVGFYGTTPIAKPTVSGSRGGNAALAALLQALDATNGIGLIVDNTTA